MQLSFGLANNANAILVDSLLVDNLLSRLSFGYDANDAHDLYELIVQVVLRDRVWLVPTNNSLRSIDVMQPWLDNGAAVHFRKRPPAGAGRRFYMAREPHFSRYVGTALHYGMPCFVTSEYRKTFEVLASPLVENAVCDAVAHHSHMTKRMQISMLRQGLSRPHLVNLRIPPLPFEVIRRSRNLGDIMNRTLEVRDQYSGLRRDLSGVSALLADPSRPPREKLKEITALERGWKRLHRTAEGSIEMTLAKSGGYLAELALGSGQMLLGLCSGTPDLAAGAFRLAKLASRLPGP